MKLTVLTENRKGEGFYAEHGLSYFIEHLGSCVLFDTGQSDVFLKNAALLGIDLVKKVDTIVLSHGHWDHGDGLQFLSDKKLLTHPHSFIKRYRKKEGTRVGLYQTEIAIRKKYQLSTSVAPLEIYPAVFFLGQIPRIHRFESKTTAFVTENGQDDVVLDDTALAIVDKGALIIVTACSHAGICNIISHAIKVTRVQKVKAIIGGFHLKYKDAQTKKTIDFIQQLGVQKLCPSHCTSEEVLDAFKSRMPLTHVSTGTVFNF